MSGMSPEEFANKIGAGLLSFPVIHFNDDASAFDERAYRGHIDWLLEHGPAGLFAAGGTGEFYSLTLDEFSRVISAAVEEVAGRRAAARGARGGGGGRPGPASLPRPRRRQVPTGSCSFRPRSIMSNRKVPPATSNLYAPRRGWE